MVASTAWMFPILLTLFLEQLLNAAIHQEYPELQTKKSELLQKQEELQEQQYNLQNRLLEELANATGDILQNKVCFFNFIFSYLSFQL